MNIVIGHLFLPKNKYQESQLKFKKNSYDCSGQIDRNVPANKELLTGAHPDNKELLTGTFRSIRNYWPERSGQ